MFLLQIFIALVIYCLIGSFVLGIETGLDPVDDFEILLYVVGWPLYYVTRICIFIGRLPFKLGVRIRRKFREESN